MSSRTFQGIKLINNRQKLIRMADASELGWRFVDEYITNPLALDEEDEKRMNRAKARATKKVKQRRDRRRLRRRKRHVVLRLIHVFHQRRQ